VQSGGRTETNANKEEKTIPVEVAAIDADNDPVRGREAAIELEFPLDVLILAVGHQSLPRYTQPNSRWESSRKGTAGKGRSDQWSSSAVRSG
jgi:hypothetical protein